MNVTSGAAVLWNNDGVETSLSILDWLLQGDPAIRWQAMRDLLGESRAVYEAERARVAIDGWGKRLLDEQDPDGNWGGGVYSPKWRSTTYTLLTLRHFGLAAAHPQALRGCEMLLARGLESDGGVNLFKTIHYSETCVNGMILTLLSYFRFPDERVHSIAGYLFRAQMEDGGWNCHWSSQTRSGATHASFNTTLLVLQGFDEYALAYPVHAKRAREAIEAGCEFLLVHRLYKSHRTGNIVDAGMTRMHFPPRWHYDFLAGLDYFQTINADREERFGDAIDLLLRRREADGRWSLSRSWPGQVFFEIEETGQPSRWNTLRALRVLQWWGAT